MRVARPLPSPTLFLDECLGARDVAEALRSVGATVEILLDHFDTGTPDEEWLPVIGQREWVLLTKDKLIRKVVRDHEPPYIATVGSRGKIRLLTNPVRRAGHRKS